MSFSWSNFFVGILGVAIGVLITKEAFYLNHHILFLGWAEKKWGPGMGTIAYRWAGVCLILFSILVMVGQINLFNNGVGRANTNNSPNTNPQVETAPTPVRNTGRSGIAP